MRAIAKSYFHIEEFNALSGWEHRTTQLEKGPVNIQMQELPFGLLNIQHFSTSCALFDQYTLPKESWLLSIPAAQYSDAVIWNGYQLASNQMAVIAPQQACMVRLPKRFESLEIAFSYELLEQHPDLEHLINTPIISLTGANVTIIEQLKSCISGVLSNADTIALSPIIIESYLVELLQEIAGVTGFNSSAPILTNQTLNRVERALVWIEQHLCEDIQLQHLAEAAQTSPRMLQMGFKQVIGISPYRYIIHRKLLLARSQFLFSKKKKHCTITEAAYGVGLSHAGRFTEYYKHLFGETPRQSIKTVEQAAYQQV